MDEFILRFSDGCCFQSGSKGDIKMKQKNYTQILTFDTPRRKRDGGDKLSANMKVFVALLFRITFF